MQTFENREAGIMSEVEKGRKEGSEDKSLPT